MYLHIFLLFRKKRFMLDEMLHQEICHIFGMNIYIFPLENALLIVKIGRLSYSLGKKVTWNEKNYNCHCIPKNMINFQVFFWVISSSINLSFFKSLFCQTVSVLILALQHSFLKNVTWKVWEILLVSFALLFFTKLFLQTRLHLL